ncbi:MAG: aspartate/tyrosine/aromatic aminotransferase [Proteobacteria bacterium]|nr:MAG: aspartate/tyrosine/aromatic aminotransferase [Pseudomonadota bacterium]
MFKLEMAPADPILGLTEAFRNDKAPDKINLGVGVYMDDNGVTPIMRAVKQAEERLLRSESTKSYLGISGLPALPALTQPLLLGDNNPIIGSGRIVTAQAPGGTGALRVAADFLRNAIPDATVWISDPTWANHNAIFKAAGLATNAYPYYNAGNQDLDRDAFLGKLGEIQAGDVVVLHGCCHNPSGVDPDSGTWKEISDIAQRQGWLPLFDFAYQGFGDGLAEDRAGLVKVLETGIAAFVCSSYSKNFGLYNERIGAVTFIGETPDEAERAFSHIKVAIRSNYSNPPSHGGAIVAEILASEELRGEWENELRTMRERIFAMRKGLADGIAARGVDRDFSFVKRQKGMFSFAGITPEQVDRLRERHHIYAVRSGRINVAGITPDQMNHVCDALVEVLNNG